MAFLATTDAERSMAFYRDQLGLTFVADEPFAVVFHAGPTVLRIQKVAMLSPAPYTALGWHVPDIGEEVAALVARGVVFERYDFLEQNAAGDLDHPGRGEGRLVQGSGR